MDMEHNAHEIEFLDELTAFLNSPTIQALLSTHPNQTTSSDFARPDSWVFWWDWAADIEDGPDRKWLQLWQYYVAQAADREAFEGIPQPLRLLIDQCRHLQLNREHGTLVSTPSGSSSGSYDAHIAVPKPSSAVSANVSKKSQGMSPKKAHEVVCMTEYTSRLLSYLSEQGTQVKHVVDVGAGQAYVTRALRDELGLDILAVDWSAVQTTGATRRDKSRASNIADQDSVLQRGSLTYKTLAINEESLLEVADEWIDEVTTAKGASSEASEELPVLLLALHACGSLTLDILRALSRRLKGPERLPWRPKAALVVGCCYNLLNPPDCTPLTRRDVVLSPNHLQLAAQVPHHWNRTPEAFREATLAVRKVAWRALLERVISQAREAQKQPLEDPSAGRLGRLNDGAYKDWQTFLSTAQRKLGLDLEGNELDRCMESRLEVFHLLRCIVGPVVESFLLLDRKVWLQERLQDTGCVVELVNLFDQKADSARNVAVVVAPSPACSRA